MIGEVCLKCGYNTYLVGHNTTCPDFDPAFAESFKNESPSGVDKAIEQFGLMLEDTVEERASLAFTQFLDSLGISSDSSEGTTILMAAQVGMRLGSGTLLQLLIEQDIIDADRVYNYIKSNTFDWGDD